MADGEADAQPRQTGGLGQGAQHQQVGCGLEIGQRQHAVAGEGLIELIHHHQRLRCGGRQLQDRLGSQARAGGVVGIAEQQQPRRRAVRRLAQGAADRLQREVEVGPLVGDGLDRHALHLGTGAVVAEGGAGGEQRLTAVAIGVEDGVNGGVNAVEQADLGRQQRSGQPGAAMAAISQVGDHRLTQAVVLRVDGDLLRRDGTQGLHHQRTGPHRVLIEVEAKQAPPPLQRGAVGVQGLHLGAGQGEAGLSRERGIHGCLLIGHRLTSAPGWGCPAGPGRASRYRR